MTPRLEDLLRKAREHVMTPEERRAQRISYVYGQLMDCNPDVSREEVERIVDAANEV